MCFCESTHPVYIYNPPEQFHFDRIMSAFLVYKLCEHVENVRVRIRVSYNLDNVYKECEEEL